MSAQPELFAIEGIAQFGVLSPKLQTTQIALVYGTDRGQLWSDAGELEGYGEARSDALTFGRVFLEFGEGLDWDEMIARSTGPDSEGLEMHFRGFEMLGAFSSSVALPVETGDGWRKDPQLVEQDAEARRILHRELARHLETTATKEVFLFVHGVDNDFATPAMNMAQLWHFLGRVGVPVVYSWPAQRGGGPLRPRLT